MAQGEQGGIRAFVPARDLAYLDEHSQVVELCAGVAYLTPSAMDEREAAELQSQGEGWCR